MDETTYDFSPYVMDPSSYADYSFGGTPADFASYGGYDFSPFVMDPAQFDLGSYVDPSATDPFANIDTSGIYDSGIYGSTAPSDSMYNPISNYNTSTPGSFDASGNYVPGSNIVNDASGNPLGYIDANGQYQSYADIAAANSANAPISAANAAQKSAATGGGSGGGGSQQKAATPAQSTAQSAVGSLAALAQILQAIKGKGAIAPAGIGTNKAATPMTWGGLGARKFASGGLNQCSCGGGTVTGHVKHASGGQADHVPARLSGGEYVMDADVVSALGDGNTDAGAAKLDQMRENLRTHKRSAPSDKIPPKAKSPLDYMKGAK